MKLWKAGIFSAMNLAKRSAIKSLEAQKAIMENLELRRFINFRPGLLSSHVTALDEIVAGKCKQTEADTIVWYGFCRFGTSE